jgi:mercuric ion transport protein
MAFRDHLDKIGIVGSFVAAACCLGLPAVLSIAGAIGLSFLIKDSILRPVIIAFLAVTILGLFLGYRAHRRIAALVLGVISSFGVYFFIYGHQLTWAAYVFIIGLIAAGGLNIVLRRSPARMRDRPSQLRQR